MTNMRLLKISLLSFLVIGLATAGSRSGNSKDGTGSAAKPAQAKTAPVRIKAVVELFTSQGCSSCPPADALLKTYADRNDVVALTLPVDYWDYLGWKDTLASPRHTARQRAYAIARRDGQVYTPQVVVNGIAHVIGSRKAAIDAAIAKTQKRFSASMVPIAMSVDKGALVIETAAAPAGAKVTGATIWLATVKKSVSIPIKRGENSGRKLTYYNVVRNMTSVGMWDGKPVTVRLAKHAVMHDGADGCIVLLQQGPAGPIIGAASFSGW